MILERLKEGIVVGDGGTLFELERRGYVSAGPFTPEVSVEHPEALEQLQTDFARAGAQVIQAYTYYAHEEKLKFIGRQASLGEINSSAVKIANNVAGKYDALVAGNLANTWVYKPGDPASHKETRRQFDQQIEYQAPHGVDFFIAETIEFLGEALIAAAAIRDAGYTAMITLGFKYRDQTQEGVALEDAFRQLEDAGVEILGLNCCRDPERMLPLAQRLRNTVSAYVATQPVAYRCSEDKPYFQVQEYQGRVAFPLELDPFVLTRFEMAEYARQAREMGINYIGGCCGCDPHHLRAMAEALGRTTPASQYSPRLELHTIIGSAEHRREQDERIWCEQKYGPTHCHFLLDEEGKEK